MASTALSPFAALAGTTTLNWYKPGLMTPANATAAGAPPMVNCGKAASGPDWYMDPAASALEGNPKPSPKSRMVSPGAAGVKV